jgi:hypothetical protein
MYKNYTFKDFDNLYRRINNPYFWKVLDCSENQNLRKENGLLRKTVQRLLEANYRRSRGSDADRRDCKSIREHFY